VARASTGRRNAGKPPARTGGAAPDPAATGTATTPVPAGETVIQADEAAARADELDADAGTGDTPTDAAATPVDEADDAGAVDTGDTDDDLSGAALWAAVGIDPVEIALPQGTGFTLRAYRPVTEITPTDISTREDDAFPQRRPGSRHFLHDEKALDEEDLDEDEPDTTLPGDDLLEEDLAGTGKDDGDDEDGTDEPAADADDSDDEADAEDDVEPEEVPLFLGHRGRLLLFRSAEGLAEYARSGAGHDLSQLPGWSRLARRVTAADVVPAADDVYELDLVVANLRAGRDAWDADLLVRAGEVARDVGYAMRLDAVVSALATGSPLDDLDDALRATANGGIGGFLARRKLKKIGAEAAPLGWRTIIGKISAVVDWRD